MGISGRTGSHDRGLGVLVRLLLQLVDHVPVGPERELCAVAELAGDVDHRAALVQQQRGGAVVLMRSSA